jgi:hypothetical protein
MFVEAIVVGAHIGNWRRGRLRERGLCFVGGSVDRRPDRVIFVLIMRLNRDASGEPASGQRSSATLALRWVGKAAVQEIELLCVWLLLL